MNVLLGIEGSDESVRALEATLERTLEADDELTVAVVEKSTAERSVAETRALATDRLETAGIDATVTTLEGDPGSALVDFAERESFDMVVIGGGTQSPMGKIRLGPITEFVLLNAPATVKLVR
ncbi:universal stress protein [Natronobiforma cellulositropha]|uniref:universal stress protein n=1 Tax=Natronobiforma cellulositropha TaxID=1679076 RepID=UPI0021D59829|nr:universal stress protein [Natronobiforma cellulositropha]